MNDATGDEELIVRLCGVGDECVSERRYDDAVTTYRQALELLPLPLELWEASTFILLAIGNACFLKGEYGEAYAVLQQALRCPSGDLDAHIHLRLGQILLAWGDEEPASTELAIAYVAGGSALFAGEDPRCLTLVQARLRPPAGGIW